MMKAIIALLALTLLATTTLAGRGRWGGRHNGRGRGGNREKGCRGLQRTEERSSGQSFHWTMNGTDDDDLTINYNEGAYAPADTQVVKKYPRDGAQRALGLKPVKVIYDYTTDNPVTVLRVGKKGKGPCILVSPDFDTYSELIATLTARNGNSAETPDDEEEIRLVARETTNISTLSQYVQNLCSRDKCGRTVQPVYFTTEAAPAAQADADDDSTDYSFSVMLVTDRLSITGLPRRMKKWGRGNRN